MEKLTDNSIMPFGKHKGEKMANVPASWLLWFYSNAEKIPENIAEYIKDNMDQLRQDKANGR